MYEPPLSGIGGYVTNRREWLCRNLPLRVLQFFVWNEIERVAPLTKNEAEVNECLAAIEPIIDLKKVPRYGLKPTRQEVGALHYDFSTQCVMFATAHLASAVDIIYHKRINPHSYSMTAANLLFYSVDSAIKYCTLVSKEVQATDQDRRLSLYMPITHWELRWLTKTACDLACLIYDEKRWELCPVLADALMDAGCEDEQTLGQLQYHWQSMGRGVWIIDHLTGRR